MHATHHFGVYGLWWEGSKLVLVRKASGPYKGLLDLLGGTPERGETIEETLQRELREETGVTLTGVHRSHSFSIRVHVDAAGHPLNFHHEGVMADVRASGPIRYNINDEDVAGVVLAEGHSDKQLSPWWSKLYGSSRHSPPALYALGRAPLSSRMDAAPLTAPPGAPRPAKVPH